MDEYEVYEAQKRQLLEQNLPPEKFEQRLRELVEQLGI